MSDRKTKSVTANTLQARFGFSDPDLTTPQHDAILLWLNDYVEDFLAARYAPLEKQLPELNKIRRSDIERRIKDIKESYIESATKNLKEKQAELTELQGKHYSSEMTWDYSFGKRSCTAEEYARKVEDAKREVTKNSNRIQELRMEAEQLTADLDRPLIVPDGWKSCEIAEKKFENPILGSRDFTIGFIDLFVRTKRYHLGLKYGFQGDGFKRSYDSEVTRYWREPPQIFRDFTEDCWYFEIKPYIPSLGEVVRQIRMYQTYAPEGRFFIVSPDTRFKDIIEAQGIGFIVAEPN